MDLDQREKLRPLPESETDRHTKTETREKISLTNTYELTELSAYLDPMEEVPPYIRAGIPYTTHQKKLQNWISNPSKLQSEIEITS
ncbi:hypothetical protein Bca4012_072296 [Brassica carinata]